jgi:ribosomal protein S18 acetylase RimI-like enzyme
MGTPYTITLAEWLPHTLSDDQVQRHLDDLGELLRQVVEGGASVNFILPFTHEEARQYWVDSVLPGVLSRKTRALFAWADRTIVGTVLLMLAPQPNQRHRADIGKMLVLPEFRRQGIARSLMTGIEAIAREEKRTLLTLDTNADSDAEPLYRSVGFEVLGTIPRYSRNPLHDRMDAATFMYKELSEG